MVLLPWSLDRRLNTAVVDNTEERTTKFKIRAEKKKYARKKNIYILHEGIEFVYLYKES